MPRNTPTLRSIAAQLGLSIATVSEALRESPRVAEETRARVLAVARKVSYRRNPLVSTVMSMVRSSRQQTLRGSIAALNFAESPDKTLIPFHQAVFEGAAQRGAELGYHLELFWIGPHGIRLRRITQILAARNIQGVMVMPFAEPRDLSELPWHEYSGVGMDYALAQPVLHTVLPDHHLTVFNALLRLKERGYRKPGLFVLNLKDRRLKYRFSSTYQGFTHAHLPDALIPPLSTDNPTREGFLAWFRQYRPDVIVSHVQASIDWLASIRVQVPRDVGFVHLNHLERLGPCAGIDMRPRGMGAAAVESVVAQIHRNERGVPAVPKTITIEGLWIEGPTIRPIGELPPSGRSKLR